MYHVKRATKVSKKYGNSAAEMGSYVLSNTHYFLFMLLTMLRIARILLARAMLRLVQVFVRCLHKTLTRIDKSFLTITGM